MGEVAAADPAQVAGVISDCKAEQNIPHTLACRVLGVSESWFYKWVCHERQRGLDVGRAS
ncbi:hypothetical protein GCM10010121_099860 [Streptomyces brasiliensis]|uniref:Transposase n=1 Tax=Streptomyces brasiliensis TaxID=1954 RepID=A0A917PEM8_9ACTN|nr:hypothetical protein GCM10010121_099860 [Streptomyces brasiliensis]